MSRTVKLVVTGDGAVGKTCLLVVYAKGRFPAEYVPTIFENYNCKVSLNNTEHTVQLWDTAGQEDLVSVRQLSYPNTDVFLLCFSIADRTSFENVKNKWIDEIKMYVPDPVCLLVGTKADLREDIEAQVSEAEAMLLARNIGAFDYMECSAIKCQGVKDIFDAAIVQVTNPPVRGGCLAGCSVQ
jgi:small GTP-binding protein